MAYIRQEDYENVANIFNESGDKAAVEYIVKTYGNKSPRGVLSRIKKSPGFKYDAVNKKILKTDVAEDRIFIDLDELCNSKEPNDRKSPDTNNSTINSIEALYIELMQDKLMELIKYIKLNHCTSTICINKSALIADGYKITFN